MLVHYYWSCVTCASSPTNKLIRITHESMTTTICEVVMMMITN